VLEGYSDTEVVEAMACHEGLALASDLGLHLFLVASDYANTVRSFKGEGFGRYGTIVRRSMLGDGASQEHILSL